jgi:hypothetical protein
MENETFVVAIEDLVAVSEDDRCREADVATTPKVVDCGPGDPDPR